MKNQFLNWPIRELVLNNNLYPKSLKKIKNPPKIIYYRGRLDSDMFEKSLAMVGSRKNTRYGQMVVDTIIPELVASKVTIISGFMYGIDSLAHESCIKYGGVTIAVLGNGLDVIYPERNTDLYWKILESGGAIMSEYEADLKPTLWTFPQRNRIVAGLAGMGVLVVEAGLKSGSLITARLAMEQRKPVYAIPGPISSSVSAGCNELIKTNLAKMVTDISDLTKKKKVNNSSQMELFNDLSPEEKIIIKHLTNEELTIDEIYQKTRIPLDQLNSILAMLEMKDVVGESLGKYYVISNGS